MKNSKIKKADFLNTFEFNGDTFYAHQYQMEDGTQINANHKTQSPFKVGDEVEYEVTGNDPKGNPKGKVGKPKESNYSGGGSSGKTYTDNSDAILFQSCMKAIVEMYVNTSDSKQGLADASDLANLTFALAKESKLKIKELKSI